MSNTPIARAVAIRGAESVTAPDRCPTCDRDIADASTIGEGLCEVQVSFDSKQRRAGGWNLAARKDCETVHRVDWRSRALAAEADAARWAKVAPLIERLRAECGEPPFRGRVPSLIECAAAILAATEATP